MLQTKKFKADLEVGSDRKFKGYASIFGLKDHHNDVVEKGAFSKSISGDRDFPVQMRFEHYSDQVPGKWTTIQEDGKGLYVEGELTPGHTVGDNALASMKHGTLDGLSIGFMMMPEDSETKNGVRHIKTVDLVEISLVHIPANPEARVDIKRALDEATKLKHYERILRDLGASTVLATDFVSRFKSVLRDSEIDSLKQRIETLQSLVEQYELRDAFEKSISIPKSILGD